MAEINSVDSFSLASARDQQAGKTRRSIWGIVALSAALLILTLVLVGCSSGSSQTTPAPGSSDSTSLDGATLLDTRCSKCHSVDRATRAAKTLEEWDQTVTRMISKGADLTQAEKSVLVDYLAENYGP
jgi:hypothetical protein